MTNFSTEPHGTLGVGDATHLGTIEQVSYTAYLIEDQWVPFHRVHGPYASAEPLVSCEPGRVRVGGTWR